MQNTWITCYDALPAVLLRGVCANDGRFHLDPLHCGQLVHAQNAIQATRLRLEFADGDALDLQLSVVGWVFAPVRDTGLFDSQRLCGGLLGLEILEDLCSFHGFNIAASILLVNSDCYLIFRPGRENVLTGGVRF